MKSLKKHYEFWKKMFNENSDLIKRIFFIIAGFGLIFGVAKEIILPMIFILVGIYLSLTKIWTTLSPNAIFFGGFIFLFIFFKIFHAITFYWWKGIKKLVVYTQETVQKFKEVRG